MRFSEAISQNPDIKYKGYVVTKETKKYNPKKKKINKNMFNRSIGDDHYDM